MFCVESMKSQLCDGTQSRQHPQLPSEGLSLSFSSGVNPRMLEPSQKFYPGIEPGEVPMEDSLPGHSDIWMELQDLLLAIQFSVVMCDFNTAMVF